MKDCDTFVQTAVATVAIVINAEILFSKQMYSAIAAVMLAGNENDTTLQKS